MSGKLKSLLAVLALGAGLSFWYAVSSSWSTSSGTARIVDAVAPTTQCTDTDSDGLCDTDETYWRTDYTKPDTDGDGFLDGEEVLSGHSPTKKGPDDLLNDKRNLTERASKLLLGGMITGDLDPKSPRYQQSIDALVDEIFAQYEANVAYEPDSFAVSSGSANELIAYGLRMSRTLKPMVAEISANYLSVAQTLRGVPLSEYSALEKKYPAQFTAFASASAREIAAFDARIREVKSVRVPAQMGPFHRSLLAYLRGTQQRYASLLSISRDPMSALISLQLLSTLTTQTLSELVDAFSQRLSAALNST